MLHIKHIPPRSPARRRTGEIEAASGAALGDIPVLETSTSMALPAEESFCPGVQLHAS